MAKHAALAFNRRLDGLFHRRTHRLRYLVSKREPGRAPDLNRTTVTREIFQLNLLASKCLATTARRAFCATYSQHKQWRTKNKGRGWLEKQRAFGKWYANKIDHRNCVYVFWHLSTCLYVGKTVHGRGRPQSHFDKHWFPKATRIDIYSTSQKSLVPRLECLAMHLFEPTKTRQKAATKKWTKKCPICEVRGEIRRELRRIFSLRRS